MSSFPNDMGITNQRQREYRKATTLTGVLTSQYVIIYDERQPDVVRKQGVGKVIKEGAVEQLTASNKYSRQQAERTIEQRLVQLMSIGLIHIADY